MPPAYHLKTEVFYGYLIDIKLISGTNYYYQNFKPNEQYSYEGQLYSYIPFELASDSEQLEINSESMEIVLANTETMRNLILSAGDIRKATVILRTIFPDEVDARIEISRGQINSYAFSKGAITISCKSPLSAINGLIPSKVFEPKVFPFLPWFNQPNVR